MADKELFNKGLAELEKLRAEVEKGIKTAGEEVREGWQRLQPHLQRVEKLTSDKASEVAQELGESAGELLDDVRGRLEELRKRIRKEPGTPG
jgi:ElaB/YqjD/DUF883 family membrane-anchored ribosome-binding protein